MMMGNAFSEDRSTADAILDTLLEQKQERVERGFYWENQIAFAYNSDKMEGSPLSKEQTRAIFETRTVSGRAVPVDAIHEASNHFELFDHMLNTVDEPITRDLLWDYHRILKSGTTDDELNDRFVVGGWKTVPNAVDGIETVPPEQVDAILMGMFDSYEKKAAKDYRDIAAMHVFFEQIHPFQDGNGRIGRILMFKECLRNGLEPFIVLDEYKEGYYESLRRFDSDPEYFTGFIEWMRDLYLEEYSALVPAWHLLPRFEEFMDRDAIAAKSASFADFFKDDEKVDEEKT